MAGAGNRVEFGLGVFPYSYVSFVETAELARLGDQLRVYLTEHLLTPKRKSRHGAAWHLVHFGAATMMLALMLVTGGCDSNNNRPIIVLTPTPTQGVPTPTATPTAGAQALWIENANGNFVAELNGTTLITPGASVPSAAVTNMSAAFIDPAGITFDSSNNQWVTSCGSKSPVNHGSLNEFNLATITKLSTDPTPPADVALSDDGTGTLVNCPWSMTFASGNLWTANSNEFTSPPGFVTEYLPSQLTASGSPTPNITLSDPTQFVSPTGVVFDSAGDLFIADFGPNQFPGGVGSGTVWVFKAATVTALAQGTNTKTADAQLFDGSTATPVNGAFDSAGNLWVADCEADGTGELYMFPKSVLTTGATAATTIFRSTSITTSNGAENTIDCPGGIAFDASGNLWYTNFNSVHVSGAVGEFTESQLTAVGTFTPIPNIFLDGNPGASNFDGPIGLAFGPTT